MKPLRIILFLIIILSLTTCKKYPDGGLVSLTYKHLFGGRKDAIKKTWELDSYIVNGIDSTNLIAGIQDIPNFKKNFADFVINDWRSKDIVVYRFLYKDHININKDEKSITFFTGMNYLVYFPVDAIQCELKNNFYYCERNIFKPELKEQTVWSIKELTKKKLVLTTTITNNYKIILRHND